MHSISSCDAEIRSALDMFHVCIPLWFIYPWYHLQISVSIRILKQNQESERNRHIENEALLAAVSSRRGQEPDSSDAPILLLECRPALRYAYCSWLGKFVVVLLTVLVVSILHCLFISYLSLNLWFS